ncbi:MAG: magnesium/cobalt transporter CorA [Alphaproteobacteria bacterium]|nr:magnesium/cobalt transporter CorA [Alphaproteobacteria bacterium]
MTPDPESSIGARPGTLVLPAGSPPPVVRVFQYDAQTCEERQIDDLEALHDYAGTASTTWIDIQGLGKAATLQRIGEIFNIHRLALADAVNVPQRPKAEVYDDYVLIVARAPQDDVDPRVPLPQVCILVARNYVVSFQERYFGFFDRVRERIREGAGRPIRTGGPSYLAYALLDVLVGHYTPILEDISDEMDDLEENLLANPSPQHLTALYDLRRKLTVLRRLARPQREALLQLSHLQNPLIAPEVAPYLRDAHDHASQNVEIIESLRDTAGDLMDTALATLGHRSNEVMKVLTLMASIFIPLTFMAGIYGMNFQDMPELSMPEAYPTLLAAMAIVAGGMIWYFRRRGWIGARTPPAMDASKDQ